MCLFTYTGVQHDFHITWVRRLESCALPQINPAANQMLRFCPFWRGERIWSLDERHRERVRSVDLLVEEWEGTGPGLLQKTKVLWKDKQFMFHELHGLHSFFALLIVLYFFLILCFSWCLVIIFVIAWFINWLIVKDQVCDISSIVMIRTSLKIINREDKRWSPNKLKN